MRRLTFKGYLEGQLTELSGVKSTSLYLFSRLSESNARLEDVLCVYIALYANESLKNRLIKAFSNIDRNCKVLSELTEENINDYFSDDKLSNYRTIYENYLYELNRKLREKNLQKAMFDKICLIQKEKQISNYRIYKSLNLNPGNVNTFLHKGDFSKVSLDTTREILRFVNQY